MRRHEDHNLVHLKADGFAICKARDLWPLSTKIVLRLLAYDLDVFKNLRIE
jgi:hypothetical protein